MLAKILSLILLTATLPSVQVLASMDFELVITTKVVRVFLINNSSDEVTINKRLALGPVGSPAELNLIVENESRVQFPYLAKIKIGAPSDQDWCLIAPGQFAGREISKDTLKEIFGLPRGRYRIKALYSSTGSTALISKERQESSWEDISID